ncbi:peptidoglycan editing factor PgeF [Acaryochloris sp. IP29b_bin.137]|uniref:peptidoglycan editing factor PgeF n=1 Tax=Acaryochloris sp. IP29b_bin.137 TaxID=2969217 RepID=UPI00261E7E9C|nr:peptidoglycan editing factor PgeF [Acaryochloris sp. IP29b_bin.137]
MHTWNWQTANGQSYLTCSLLDPWPHGFFTRAFFPLPPAELAPILHPQAHPFRIKQVHGNQVLGTAEVQTYWDQLSESTDTAEPLPEFPPADGLISQDSDQAIWVCTADCTPVLMADVRLGQVAAVHAGWRGTAAKIVPVALTRLQNQGSQLQDIRVAMGPAIAGSVYQVTTDVAAQVGRSVIDPNLSEKDDDTVTKQLLQADHPPLLADPEPGRVRLDVRRVNAMQLEQMGLLPEQIAIAPHCTYQEPDIFFSYRREQRKQVQWSGIVSR